MLNCLRSHWSRRMEVSPSKGSSKKEVIMVDPLEAKRLAAKQMEAIKAKEKLKVLVDCLRYYLRRAETDDKSYKKKYLIYCIRNTEDGGIFRICRS